MNKLLGLFFSVVTLSANAGPADDWPDATLLLVNNSGYSIQMQIPQQSGLAKKIVNLSDNENKKVIVKIPMDVSIEVRAVRGELQTIYCEVNLPQVLEEEKNEVTVSSTKCPNSSMGFICRQSKENK